MPWDLEAKLASDKPPILLDIREPAEFLKARIQGSINVPRGVLEQACEYGFEETEPDLASARDKQIIVICRSGNRSVLAAHTLQLMGFSDVYTLKTGIKGWNDYEQPLVSNNDQAVSTDEGYKIFEAQLRPDQQPPKA